MQCPITLPIFTAGAIEGTVKASEAVQQQTLFRYQQAIQNSFREVDDALIDQNRTREQLQAQLRQIEALRSYVRLARLRWDEGYTSYLEVLDAERSLFNAELSLHPDSGHAFPGPGEPLQSDGRRLGGGGGQDDGIRTGSRGLGTAIDVLGRPRR